MKAKLAVIALGFSVSAAQAEMYKCTISGQVVFQDHACPGASADDNKIHPADTSQGTGGSTSSDSYLVFESKLRTKVESHQVAVGMTEEQVRTSWGPPTSVNSSSSGEQWVYRRGNSAAQYVYFRGGLVSGWN